MHLDGAGPTAIVLARQNTPVLAGTAERGAVGLAKGAYVLVDETGDEPELVLVGTGSEVSLCVTAAETLAADGVSVRVVSFPSWELFEAQPAEYRSSVLPAGVPTLAVEAGASLGWDRYADAVIAIDHYGASAPGATVIAEFGFTPEHVVERARASSRRRSGQARSVRRDQFGETTPVTTQEFVAMTSAIAHLNDLGQSPWYDNLARPLLSGGGLQTLVTDDGIRGVTSNPTILDKAIDAGEGYDEQLAACAASGQSIEDTYWNVVIDDIKSATDILRPVYDSLDRSDGFVSLEVSPVLAHDTAGTIAMAKSLWSRVDRPNLMIKIPATLEGIPAIEEVIASGINVNVTLIFSISRHELVIEAYLKGLERLAATGGDLSSISSVASFFVSRVDTETDSRLPDDSPLRGKTAVANAKLAYELFRQRFSGARWEALAAQGARLQRPLWASTSTKNPAYSSTLYVDELIGTDTVNTMAPASIEALAAGRGHPGRRHGRAGSRRRAPGDGRPRGRGRRHRRRHRHARARRGGVVRRVVPGRVPHHREAPRRSQLND